MLSKLYLEVMMRRVSALGLALGLLLAGVPAARADEGAACGAQPFRVTLQDVKGKLYDGVASIARTPVVLAYYQGYKSSDVLENLREALKTDAVVGKGTALHEQWSGFAIVDYKEGWFVPGWAIDKALREKMQKHPKAVFLADKGECLTKEGSSDKCPGKARTPYFQSGAGSVAVLYRGFLMKKYAGKTDAAPFVQVIRKLTELGARDADVCEARRAVGG